MTTHLLWFRKDLRVTDNPALSAACEDPDAKVIAVFIATPHQWEQHDMSPKQAAFIYAHLEQLQQSLALLGIPFFYHQVDDFKESVDWLVQFCNEQKVDALFYNRQYEFDEQQRDSALEKALDSQIHVYRFDDSVLTSPGTITNKEGAMYKVFTPFRRAFIKQLSAISTLPLPAPQARMLNEKIVAQKIKPFDYPVTSMDTLFPIGEQAALDKLDIFCEEYAAHYFKNRDFPALNGTSCLSPYLAIGILSPRQCLSRLQIEYPNLLESSSNPGFSWLNELIWREFYRHLLIAWPDLCKYKPFISWTQHIVWQHSAENLLAWQEGKTGYPIVDAAMKQLNKTGWMHNRLRMITASFLVKDLLIDWRAGEKYFMSQLIDGDLAANNGGWQWSSSTGVDAAPYFRIFNPTTQGKRFDPEGVFIKKWLPELAQVPAKHIHQPHEWAKKNGHKLDYPHPIVDHNEARRRTLAAFNKAKRQNVVPIPSKEG